MWVCFLKHSESCFGNRGHTNINEIKFEKYQGFWEGRGGEMLWIILRLNDWRNVMVIISQWHPFSSYLRTWARSRALLCVSPGSCWNSHLHEWLPFSLFRDESTVMSSFHLADTHTHTHTHTLLIIDPMWMNLTDHPFRLFSLKVSSTERSLFLSKDPQVVYLKNIPSML